MIRSSKSRVPLNASPGSHTIRQELRTTFGNDSDLIDFLEQCLCMDPEERLTPDEALNHPWIVGELR